MIAAVKDFSMAIKDHCDCGGTSAAPNRECERCRLVHTVRAALKVRECQKAYFSGRTGQLLREAQAAEKYLDSCLRRLNVVQPTLFEVEDEQ